MIGPRVDDREEQVDPSRNTAAAVRRRIALQASSPGEEPDRPDCPSVQSAALGWPRSPDWGSTTGLSATFGCSSVHCHWAADHCEYVWPCTVDEGDTTPGVGGAVPSATGPGRTGASALSLDAPAQRQPMPSYAAGGRARRGHVRVAIARSAWRRCCGVGCVEHGKDHSDVRCTRPRRRSSSAMFTVELKCIVTAINRFDLAVGARVAWARQSAGSCARL